MMLACVRQPAKFPESDALGLSRECLSVTKLLLEHIIHIVHSPPGLQAVNASVLRALARQGRTPASQLRSQIGLLSKHASAGPTAPFTAFSAFLRSLVSFL
jgi:hypothetical protein